MSGAYPGDGGVMPDWDEESDVFRTKVAAATMLVVVLLLLSVVMVAALW